MAEERVRPRARLKRLRWTNFIIVVNVIVFSFWLFSDQSDEGFMVRNFLVSWDALLAGRYWTLLTSVFSHLALFHLLLNMLVLLSFGTVIEIVLGARRFLAFYLAAGTFASLSHCIVSTFLLEAPYLPALGASGAIAGLVLLFSLLFPRERILLFGIVPLPAIWGALLFVGLDLWGLFAQAQGGGLPIGYGAHLGGAASGVIYYFAGLRRHQPDFAELLNSNVS